MVDIVLTAVGAWLVLQILSIVVQSEDLLLPSLVVLLIGGPFAAVGVALISWGYYTLASRYSTG